MSKDWTTVTPLSGQDDPRMLSFAVQYSNRIVERLEKARRALEMVIDQIPDPVVVVDRRGQMFKGNEAAKRLLGDGTSSQFINIPLSELFPGGGEHHRLLALVRRVAEYTMSVDEEVVINCTTACGSVCRMAWSVRHIPGGRPDEPIFLVHGRKITEAATTPATNCAKPVRIAEADGASSSVAEVSGRELPIEPGGANHQEQEGSDPERVLVWKSAFELLRQRASSEKAIPTEELVRLIDQLLRPSGS